MTPPRVNVSVDSYKVAFLEAAPLFFFGIEIDLATICRSLCAFGLGYSVAHQSAECLTQRAVGFIEVELNDALRKQHTQFNVDPRAFHRLAHGVTVLTYKRPCKHHNLAQLIFSFFTHSCRVLMNCFDDANVK